LLPYWNLGTAPSARLNPHPSILQDIGTLMVEPLSILLALAFSVALPPAAALGSPTGLRGTTPGGQGSSAATEKSVTFSGVVVDQTGALVPNASVNIAASNGAWTRDLVTDTSGRFSLHAPAGVYHLLIMAPGFDAFAKEVRVGPTPVSVRARLIIPAVRTVVQVSGDDNPMSGSEDANKDAMNLKGGALATLSDDDATFQQQLLALAGDDGSHPPQAYVDGFSGGVFPPKSTIREVKINQNPYSAEYESMGMGRIEVFTRPGTGSIHGSVDIFGDPSGFNSQNPFLHQAEPAYYRLHTAGELSGPIDKKSSFFLSADFYDQQNNAIVNAQSVSGAGSIYGVSEAVPDPTTTGQYSARLDRQFAANNTFIGRFEFDRVGQINGGLSQYILPSEAYDSSVATQTLQMSDAETIGANGEIESRLEWIRTRTNQNPLSTAPTVVVEGTVSGGGSPEQVLHDKVDQIEFQENGSYQHSKQLIRGGVRYRLYRDASLSTAGFNGTFAFTDLASYQASLQGKPSASQFQLTAGKANFSVITGDVALWAEDQWKLRENLTANLGFRFESQSAIPDHADPSPHIALAWALHQTGNGGPSVVLRIGSGIFYDRFPIEDLMTAVRENNPRVQQTYTVAHPDFFVNNVPSASQLESATPPTIYRVAAGLRSEYEIDSGASAEFRLGTRGSLSVTYLNKVQEHQWVSINANAPRPDGTRPYGVAAGTIYEFSSGAEGRGTWLYTDPRMKLGRNLSAWGHFMLKRQTADTFGPTSFASNSYNIHQDYGRSPSDRRQAAYAGVDANWKWGLSTALFLTTRGGEPFNITTGADNNGDTLYNDRPSFASSASNPADVVHTAYGNLDLNPAPGEKIIPVNYGRSAGPFVSLQLQASKTWKFGEGPAGLDRSGATASLPAKRTPPPDPRYALVLSVEAQNVTNTVSPAPPIGVLTSPFFGQAIATSNNFLSTTAANRTITLHAAFQF
jgi:hypothetical protein